MLHAARRFIQRETAYNDYDSWYGFIRNKNKTLKANTKTLRHFAKTPIARSAITQIKDGVMALPWHFVAIDGQNHDLEIKKLTSILSRPNQVDDYYSFFRQILEDLLVLDMAPFEKKIVTSNVQPIYLFPIDPGTIKVLEGWNGNPNEPRWSQSVNGKEQEFTDDQVAVLSKEFFTHSYFGKSPTETALTHLKYLVDSQDYSNGIASNAMPKYLVNVGDKVGQKELDKLRAYIENDVQGDSTLGIIGAAQLDSKQVSPIGDEAMCLAWQKMLLQIISVCYGVPAERLGSAISNDRSTVGEQEENFIENVVKPWAKVLERGVNKHVVERLGLYGKVRFEYIYLPNATQKKDLKDMVTSVFERDLISMNEAREILKGVFPIELPSWADGNMRLSEYKTELNIRLAKENGAASAVGDAKANNKSGDGTG